MRLQKDKIIKTALAVLDRDGLEGVTLRRLAKELNVQAPTIYWHIANKEALLDEMANAILAERFGSLDFTHDARDWAEWLDTLAHELRAAMLAYREGGRVVAGAHLGIAVVLAQLMDLTTRVMGNAGFNPSKAATITVTVITFTFGFVIEEQASPPLVVPPDLPFGPFARAENLRTLAAALEAWQNEGEDIGARFDTSIRIIINGVRAELKAA